MFHSFRDFNLQSHESATFSGPTNVQNIISRVTGGNPSSIDGLLRSTIPNADMYLLNPAGITFGPHAKLDVQGSFHASTAHTLKLQDGGEFNARTPANSLLTIAPIASFGFIDDNIAPISVAGAGEVNNRDWQPQPPASSQSNYLTRQTPPASYNESASGLYAQSDSQDPASGAGGKIHLVATDVTLSNHGNISTSFQGTTLLRNLMIWCPVVLCYRRLKK